MLSAAKHLLPRSRTASLLRMTENSRYNFQADRAHNDGACAPRLDLGDAILFGSLQGLTEFLPVSSSAHLTLARTLLGAEPMPRVFDIALHGGTTAALLIESGRQLLATARTLGEDAARHRTNLRCYRPGSWLALRLGLATVPAVVVGAFYHGDLEAWAKHPQRIAMALAAGALPMALAEASASNGRSRSNDAVPTSAALVMGLAQAAALAPGISRSGATVAAGMFAGLDRESATRYSFLLAVPVTAAATVRSLPALRTLLRQTGPAPLTVAIGSALVAGLAGIEAMKRISHTQGLLPFALYRIALAGLWRSLPRNDRSTTKPTPPDRPAPR